MADRFTFTGQSQVGYPGYRDQDTQKMLTADPGGTYAIAAIDLAGPVPPQDGRWEPAADGLPPPPEPGPPPWQPAVTVAPVPAPEPEPAPEPADEPASDDTEGEQA